MNEAVQVFGGDGEKLDPVPPSAPVVPPTKEENVVNRAWTAAVEAKELYQRVYGKPWPSGLDADMTRIKHWAMGAKIARGTSAKAARDHQKLIEAIISYGTRCQDLICECLEEQESRIFWSRMRWIALLIISVVIYDCWRHDNAFGTGAMIAVHNALMAVMWWRRR